MSLSDTLKTLARRTPDADDAAKGAERLWRSGRSLARTSLRRAKGQVAPEPAGAKVGRIVGGVIGAVVVVGAGLLAAEWLRERQEQEPEYDVLREDGAISVRRYRPMIVATADAGGSMKGALETGFRRLFAYISGKVRPSGDDSRIAMTVPVIAAPTEHPGGWLIRFVMPAGKPREALPQPGPGVTIDQVPARVIAAIRFPGRITEQATATRELDELRAWVKAQGLSTRGEPEFAAYNSPMIPGPARRNEWWIEVGEAAA